MLRRFGPRILLGLLGLSVFIIVGLGLFLSVDKEISERHEPYLFSENFDFESGSFEEYISFSQRHLRAARTDSPSEQIIQNASPFMFEPGPECARLENGKYQNGIVLSHGLIASPYSMVSIAEYFQSRCFYVLGPLLPDHVTRPGDFIDTRWEDWAQVQSFAIDILAQNTENIFLSGHSAGATLAVYEAARNPIIDGLILFTPALQITPAAKYARFLTPLTVIFSKAAWFEIRSDEASYRYESITFSAAAETYALIQAMDKALADTPLSIPVFTVASVQDNTVNTDTVLAFMAQQQHPASQTLLFSQHSIANIPDVVIHNSYAPEQGVLSVSHLGIMTPASHAEYGRDGAYRNCGHYYGQENTRWTECKAGQRDYYGEVNGENLQQGLIERIAFNPFYDELLVALDGFIDSF
jgi:esterase/lipase